MRNKAKKPDYPRKKVLILTQATTKAKIKVRLDHRTTVHRDPVTGFVAFAVVGMGGVGPVGGDARRPGQDPQELRVLHLGVVVADRRRAEERHEVEVLTPAAAVVDPRAVALLVVEDEREPVHEHVPGEDLMATTMELAQRLAQAPTRAIGLTKRAMNRALSLDQEAALAYETDMQEIAGRTHDHKEGLQAFLEKRPPNFSKTTKPAPATAVAA